MELNEPRNPGPSWGFEALNWWDQRLPRPLRNGVSYLGSAIAYASMRSQRKASQEYLQAILGRQPANQECIRQFHAFTNSLLAKLRAGRNNDLQIDWADKANEKAGAMMYSDEPILLGTFHVGASDLMGFHIHQTGRKVCMVRQRVENSADLEHLISLTAGMVEIIWVNKQSEVVYAIHQALGEKRSLAMQCDRIEHASKTESFEFLGENRLFPFTIYRLANIYGRPVQFCIALPLDSESSFGVYAHDAYIPEGKSREADLRSAREHFQSVLNWLEGHLRENPYQWFNFLKLNPIATADTDLTTCNRVPHQTKRP
ncbi:MAG: hypothetical protein AAFX93_16940 [Verrucomicrobiota bacterium]